MHRRYLKLKHLAIWEAQGDIGEPMIEIKVNAEEKTLHIIDQGLV